MIDKLIIILVIILVNSSSAFAQSNESNIKARLGESQTKQGVQLDDQAKQKVSGACQKSQIFLSGSRQLSDTAIQKRISFYTDVQKELQALEQRMLRQGADSSEIDLLIGRIQQSLDIFTIKADDYGSLISDLISVDCVNNPELFYSGLVDLRHKRAELSSSAMAVKKVLADAKSNTFEALKKRLTV